MDQTETVSIKEFLEMKINTLSIHTQMRFDSLDIALRLAAKNADDKYEHLNKLKEEVARDKEKFLTTSESKKEHESLMEWKQEVNTFMTKMNTRIVTWTSALGLFYIALSLLLRWYGK